MTVGSQMPELDPRGLPPPPYKIGSQITPYKLGIKTYSLGDSERCYSFGDSER